MSAVAFNVDTNESVCWKRAYFEFFAKEFNHFQQNCILVAQDQAVIYVQDEEGYFLTWLPRTEVAVVNAGITFRSLKTKGYNEFIKFYVPNAGGLL
jgi:hypothetical protein